MVAKMVAFLAVQLAVLVPQCSARSSVEVKQNGRLEVLMRAEAERPKAHPRLHDVPKEVMDFYESGEIHDTTAAPTAEEVAKNKTANAAANATNATAPPAPPKAASGSSLVIIAGVLVVLLLFGGIAAAMAANKKKEEPETRKRPSMVPQAKAKAKAKAKAPPPGKGQGKGKKGKWQEEEEAWRAEEEWKAEEEGEGEGEEYGEEGGEGGEGGAGLQPGQDVESVDGSPAIRFPKEGMRMCFCVEVVSGTDMPEVNLMGGCDPQVEIRLVTGEDPSAKSGGNTGAAAKWSVKSQVQHNSMQPQWHEHLELDGASYRKGLWFQIILWDHGMSGNTAIGHTSLELIKEIDGLHYTPMSATPEQKKHVLKFANAMSATSDLKTTVSMNLSYCEVHKYHLKIISGDRFPKVDTMGTIDSYIEWRVARNNPEKEDFRWAPDETILASGKTRTVPDSIDPEWKQDFTFEIPGFPTAFLQLVIWDEHFSGNNPILHSCMPMKDIQNRPPGQEKSLKQEKVKFVQLTNYPCTADYKKTTLKYSTWFEQVFTKSL